MAFKGDLKNISMFDVLQTLHQNKQTGVLLVQRDGTTKKVFIDPDGVRVFFTRASRPLRLGEIFVRRGRITPQDVEILLLQQKQSYRPMGELLVESGKVRQEEVDTVLRYHAEDEIYETFAWEHGTFAFYDGQTAENTNNQLSDVLLDPAGLCLEAARQLDEIERYRGIVADNECYFVQSGELEPDRELNSEAVCATFDALAHSNSVNDLRDLVGLSLYEVLDAVVQLVEGNMIRMLGPEELLHAGRAERDAGDHERAAQMLEKAHRLDPTNREILEECTEIVQRLDDPHRLSAHYATLGRLYMASGQNEEASELLEQALRKDSDNRETLSSLRNAFAELGDAERTAEISLKMARSFAEQDDLDRAIEECRTGQEMSPGSIALRFNLAQFLARGDRDSEAKHELNALIRETESSAKAMRSRKAHDLLKSCYRLLLKIDPEDEDAHRGMRSLDRRRVSTMRNKKLVVQGGIAAAILAVIGVVGLMLRGPSAEEMLDRVQDAYLRHDAASVRRRVTELLDAHPDSPEAQRARGLLSKIEKQRLANDTETIKRKKAIQADFDEAWEEVRAALNDRPYLEGLALVEPFLQRLNKPQAAFLRAAMKVQFEYELSAFLDRILKQFGSDRQQVALAEYQLRKSTPTVKSCKELEGRLARVRARNWTELVPQLQGGLRKIVAAPQAGKTKASVEAFDKMIGDTQSSFADLGTLYFTVRRKRLRLEITEAVNEAREKRLDLLRRCEFAQARKLYATAFTRADAVTDEEPREHFRELIKWLDSTNTRQDMREKRDEIDRVVSTLKEIERLRKKEKIAAAYRLFRPLVVRYPVIQFERKYTMPYLVRSTPTGATVMLNGRNVGRTPVGIELDIVKRAEIVVKRAGFIEATAHLMATGPNLSGELHLDLTKKTAWKRTIHGRVEAPPRLAKDGRRYLVLLATSNADLIALDAKTGVMQWAAETKLLDRITAPPVVAKDYVYVITVAGLLHRVRLRDGAFYKKRLRLPGQVNHGAAYDGETLYVATLNRRLLAIRGATVVYDESMRFAPTTRLVYAEGKLFVGTAEGVILVHDAATGKSIREMRTRGASSFVGGIAVHKNLIVAGAEDGSLYAFDQETGRRIWRYPTSGPVTAPPLSGKYLFLPASDGYLHALNAKGKAVIRYELDGPSRYVPAVANGFLYAAGGDRVTAFDTADERAWWEFEFKSADGVPEHVLAGGGVLVVITSRSQVVGFSQDER